MIEDKATRYHRRKRQIGVLSVVWSASLLVLLLVTGASHALRDFGGGSAHQASASPTLEVVTYVTLLLLVAEVAAAPLAFYSGFVLERRYGLSTQTASAWLKERAKGLGVSGVLAAGGAAAVYAFIRWSPDGWWLPTGALFAVVLVGLANLGPVLLLPLFYPVKPLSSPTLSARLIALAERAGARVLGVYEWGLSAQTRKANAALTGIGSTRRILVSDTMLTQYSEDEIEVVMAHELAHHVHGDIWRGLALESVLVMAGAFAASLILPLGVQQFGLRSVADVAGLPLLLLAGGAVSIAVRPLAHALSRLHERRADQFALRLTRNPAAFISAMKRLGAQNMAEEEPSALARWLFYSHPPIRERIAMAQRSMSAPSAGA